MARVQTWPYSATQTIIISVYKLHKMISYETYEENRPATITTQALHNFGRWITSEALLFEDAAAAPKLVAATPPHPIPPVRAAVGVEAELTVI